MAEGQIIIILAFALVYLLLWPRNRTETKERRHQLKRLLDRAMNREELSWLKGELEYDIHFANDDEVNRWGYPETTPRYFEKKGDIFKVSVKEGRFIAEIFNRDSSSFIQIKDMDNIFLDGQDISFSLDELSSEVRDAIEKSLS